MAMARYVCKVTNNKRFFFRFTRNGTVSGRNHFFATRTIKIIAKKNAVTGILFSFPKQSNHIPVSHEDLTNYSFYRLLLLFFYSNE